MPTPWMPLGAGRAHAFPRVGHRAHVGEEEVLDAGAERAHGEVRARLLLDLRHAGHVGKQVDRPPEVLEGVEIVRRVLGHELDVVEHLRVPDELDDGRPRDRQMGAESRRSRAQELPQPIGAHDLAHFVPATVLSVDFTRSAPTLPTHLS
jgi:hypothetical protein